MPKHVKFTGAETDPVAELLGDASLAVFKAWSHLGDQDVVVLEVRVAVANVLNPLRILGFEIHGVFAHVSHRYERDLDGTLYVAFF